jgi:hypothetical protein
VRRPRPRAALLGALSGIERLVLLGDVIELRHGPRRVALDAAETPLRELGAALAPGAEVVIVPGNHDHRLLAPWLQRRGDRLRSPSPIGLQAVVDWAEPEPLATLARWLGPATLEVAYPGYWLRDDVYAIHGHYADRHTTVPMLERLGAGAIARITGADPGGPRTAEDYEATLDPMYAWIDAIAQAGGPASGRASPGASARAWRTLAGHGGGRGLRRRVLATAFPALIAGLNRAGIGPLSADLSSVALRRAGLDAIGEVMLRLGVDARYVIFGHTHRAGPLPADDPAQWRTVTGARLTNAGCWVDEPGFAGSDPGASPYRAGFGVIVEDSGSPRLINLLDGH